MDKALRVITEDGTLVAVALDSTEMVRRAEQIHQTSAVVTAALGRLLTAASMMGTMLKGKDDSITLRVRADGPVGQLLAVTDSDGNVRGYAEHPIVELPLREDGKLPVGDAVGNNGLLYVVRDAGGKEPYVGCTPLVTGEIAEDITRYYADSEQTPTVCALGVLVNADLTVQVAGGLLIQLLPFCPDEVIDQLEKNLASLPSMTQMLSQGLSPEDICARALQGFAYNELEQYQPQYRCNCSRERVEGAFATMNAQQLRETVDESGKVEVTCSFCDRVYTFTKAQIEQMAEVLEKKSEKS